MFRYPYDLARNSSAGMLLLVAACVWMLPGCSQDDEIGSYEAPREEPADQGHGMGTMISQPASPATGQELTYEAPDNWKQGKVGGMRKAAFRVEDGDQKAEITVIDLAAAAGMLLPNVNIWRQQVQLGEATAEDLKDCASPFEVADVKGQYVELMGPEDAGSRQAILAVMAVRGPKSWFFKLKGDAELALKEKERFQAFVKSVKFQTPASGATAMSPHGGGTPMSPHGAGMAKPAHGTGMAMSAHGSGPIAPPFKYDVPEQWKPGPARGMRKAAFRIEEGDQRAEVTAIDLSASAGALLPNINRWRQQLKLGEITEEELKDSISAIPVAGVEGQYVELLAPEDAERRMAILGVVAVREGKSWFFKMMGDADLAIGQKEQFQEFVKSIEFVSDKKPAPKEPAPKEAAAKEAAPEAAADESAPEKPAEETTAEEPAKETVPAKPAVADPAPKEAAAGEGAGHDE